MNEFIDWIPSRDDRDPDPQEESAVVALREFFESHREDVFTSRQVEVIHEERYFHWVTNRAIRRLEREGVLRSDTEALAFGGTAKVIWHKSYRYPRRSITRLIRLVEEYSDPNIGVARMLPKHWIEDIRQQGGFGLVLKYQLYPWAHRELARSVREELRLPVDSPRALADGTMARFVRWHEGRRRL